ncbi:MAG: 6-pyruvoyl trahydropterin synthase family protein [Parvibaculales bacterium]
MQIMREFHFEAAHHLSLGGEDSSYRRMHGHSFRASVFLRGSTDGDGQVMDFSEFGRILDEVKSKLDHHYLNDIKGLEVPTLENIALWLWRELSPHLPALSRIELHRDSCQEHCIYEGEESG